MVTRERRGRTLLLCRILASGAIGCWPACEAADGISHLAGKAKSHDGMLRSGTAFFVTQSGEMLTSAHVVRGCQQIDVWPADLKRLPASLVAIDDQRDIALLATNRTVETAARPIARSVRRGAPVYTIGFGLTPSTPLVPVMTLGSVRGTVQPKGHRLLVLRAALHEGNSGGPVVDAQGALLGMIVGRYADKPELSVAVPAQDLGQFLAAMSAAPAPSMPPPAPEVKPGARLRQISALVQCAD